MEAGTAGSSQKPVQMSAGSADSPSHKTGTTAHSRLNSSERAKEEKVPEVRIGAVFVTPYEGRRLQVGCIAGEGTRAKVYRTTEIDTGRTFALKVIHEYGPIYLKSIAVELPKVEVLAACKLPCAGIIERGDTYVIKEWVEGVAGDRWVHQWLEEGADPDNHAFVTLIDLFEEASRKGLHVDDLRPSNLILRNGTEWVIIDSGTVYTGVSPTVAMRSYRERFVRRWLWVGRSPFWYVVYWIWCKFRKFGCPARRPRHPHTAPAPRLDSAARGNLHR